MKPLSQENPAADNLITLKIKIRERLLWAKSWRVLLFSSTCSDCNEHAIVYIKDKEMSILCKDCLLSRTFGEVTEK